MQTFETAAVVGLIDNMSGPLKTLAKQAKELAKTIEGGKLDPSGANQYAAGLNKANTAAKEHLKLVSRIHAAWKEVGGLVAGVMAAKMIHGGVDAIKRYAPLESATRYQRAIGDYSDSDMSNLDRQMKVAADKWGMKLLDTKEAQQVFTTRNFSAPITEAATNASIILGRAMNTTAVEAGKMLEGAVFGQGIHLKDPATARLETMRAADMAAVAAKKGAMTPEDIKQLNIYGMAPAHAAGLTAEQVYATGMTFKRANIDGTQAGTFLRAASSRLVAPTSMGRDALTLMLARQGLTLDNFNGGIDLSPEAMDKALAQNGKGRRLTAKGIASFNESVAAGRESDNPDDDVYASRAAFAAAARKSLEDSGQTFDKGEVPKIVSHMLRLRDIAMEKARTAELYDNILHNATQQEKIKIFGDKQGGRAGSLDPSQYDAYLQEERGSGGYATKIAGERMEGLNASMQRLEAGFDNLSNSMVQANEKWLTPLMNKGADFMNAMAGMSEFKREALTAAAGIVTLGAAAKGAAFALGIISSLKGGGAAAAAENVAAGALGGNAKNIVKGAAAAAGGSVLPWLALAAVGAGAVYGISQLPDGSGGRRKGYGRGASVGSASEDYWAGVPLPQRSSFWHTDAGIDKGMLSSTGRQLRGSTDLGMSSGWYDSAKVKIGDTPNGDAKWGNGQTSKAIEVTGTVNGKADIYNNIQVNASKYFEGLVQRAEAASQIPLNGRLGTSMQGPGDNGAKPSAGGLTGAGQ